MTLGVVSFPSALDDASSLLDTANSLSTGTQNAPLAADITSGAATITVDLSGGSSGKGGYVAANGAISVGDEIVYYASYSVAGSTGTFSSCLRGQDGTTAAAHTVASGALVLGYLVRAHVKLPRDASIAIQTKLGAGSSTPTAGLLLMGNGTGTSTWTSVLTGATYQISTGYLGIGVAPSAPLHVKETALGSMPSYTDIGGATANVMGLLEAQFSGTTVPSSGELDALKIVETVDYTGTNPAGLTSFDALSVTAKVPATNATASQANTQLAAAFFKGEFAGSGGYNKLVAGQFSAIASGSGAVGALLSNNATLTKSGTGVVNQGNVYWSGVTNSATGAITAVNQFYAGPPNLSGGGTIGTLTGLYLDTQAAAGVTNPFGLYQAGPGDLNYFAGPIGHGVGPTVGITQTLKGLSASVDISRWLDQAGNVMAYLKSTGDLVVRGPYVDVRSYPGTPIKADMRTACVDGAMTSGSAVLTSPSNPFTVADQGRWVIVPGAGASSTTATGSITSGTNVLNVTGSPFTAADVDKWIRVNGAGPAGANLVTTITGWNTANQVLLATNASTTVASGGTVVWAPALTTTVLTYTNPGSVTLNATASNTVTAATIIAASDDTAAIQNAITNTTAWTTLQFPAGNFFIATGPIQVNQPLNIRGVSEVGTNFYIVNNTDCFSFNYLRANKIFSCKWSEFTILAPTNQTAGAAIHLGNIGNCVFENISIKGLAAGGYTYQGISIHAATECFFDKMFVQGCAADGVTIGGNVVPSTTLSAAITTTTQTTGISLTSTAGFTTDGVLLVDNEVITYTGLSGTTLTGVTRGTNGTTAATHLSGATIRAWSLIVDVFFSDQFESSANLGHGFSFYNAVPNPPGIINLQGIYIGACFTNNNHGNGIYLNVSNNIKNVFLRGTIIDSNWGIGLVAGQGGGAVSVLRMQDIWASYNATPSLSATAPSDANLWFGAGVADWSINGGYILGAGHAGIAVSGATRGKIQNCAIYDNNQTSGGGDYGIELYSTTTYLDIQGNRIYNTFAGPYHQSGIYSDNTVGQTGINITYNFVDTNRGGSGTTPRNITADADINDIGNIWDSTVAALRDYQDAIGTTTTDGYQLINSTAATAGATQQYAPSLRFTGAAWTGSVSQAVDARETLIPVNAATPTGKLSWSFSVNSGAFVEAAGLSQLGLALSDGGLSTALYRLHTLGAGARVQALATPAAPTTATATTGGTLAAATYLYWIVAEDRNGYRTLTSPSASQVTTGTTSTVTVTPTSLAGAVKYYVLRKATAPTIGGTESILVGSSAGAAVVDTGAALSSFTNAARNNTADLTVDGNALLTAMANPAANVAFTATANKASTLTAQTVSMVGTGVGTMTLPANFLVAGRSFRLKASGYLTTGATAGTLNWLFQIGGATIVSSGALAPTISLASIYWECEVTVTCRSIGTSGTVIAEGHVDIPTSTTAMARWGMVEAVASTVDTTVSRLVDLQLTTSNALHTITCTNVDLTILQ